MIRFFSKATSASHQTPRLLQLSRQLGRTNNLARELRRELSTGRSIEIRWFDKLSYEDTLKQIRFIAATLCDFLVSDGCRCGWRAHRETGADRLYATADAPIFTMMMRSSAEDYRGPCSRLLDVSRKATAVAMRILVGRRLVTSRTAVNNL